MVGEAAPVLSTRRLAALAALLLALVAWDAGAGRLPQLTNDWDVAVTAVAVIPATLTVVWLLLPVARLGARVTFLCAVGLGVAATALHLAGADAAFNVLKVTALVFAGFAFLALFEELSWVVLLAAIIPWVDALSVWRGPTKVVVEQKPGVFERISIGFRLPGESDGVRLGPPDILFFALFLGSAQRFGLRVGWTWACMTALVGLTLVAAYVFALSGLPALPAIALGFLAPNADLLLARWREQRRTRRAEG